MSHDSHNGDAMKKNGNGHLERRLAFLEKVCLDDRERWGQVAEQSKNNDRYFRSILAVLGRQGDAIREQRATLQQHDETLRQQGETLRQQGESLRLQGETLRRQGEELRRQGDELRRQGDTLQVLVGRMDATLKILYRRMEQG